jgi:hypothetical protein
MLKQEQLLEVLKMCGQSIKPSQFILTYGVGAILETRDGPNMIMDFENWGQMFSNPNANKSLSDFEIVDPNLKFLLNGNRIFSIPTNADLEAREDKTIYRTGLFPRWGKCEKHGILYPLSPSGLSNCPKCPPRQNGQFQAIRFVRACANGHLDDIEWDKIVHSKTKNCGNKFFDWVEPTSGDLRNVTIKCKCGAEANLWDIYNQTTHCSGYSPESDRTEKCDKEAIVILRSASNLRVSELVSALTIPPKCTKLHNVLSLPTIQVILSMNQNIDKSGLLNIINGISKSSPNLIKQESIKTIEEYTDTEIKNAIKDSRQPLDPNLTPQTLKEKEFDALKSAALHGYPLDPKRPEDFEVEKGSEFELSCNLKIRVTPVKRLKVVMAQKGYRRYARPRSIPVEAFTPKLVEKFFFDGHDRWYPGIALRGEGLFFDLAPNETLDLDEEIAEKWFREFSRYTNHNNFHPTFVFWHTLAHRIIQALGLDSGYSSTSIRERIYTKLRNNGKNSDGGFLLYTSRPGGDGSLGGLIALVPKFSNIINAALRNLNACSNDPLCEEQVFAHGKANGAACYACLFLSETSCDHHNIFLDRNLLRKSV